MSVVVKGMKIPKKCSGCMIRVDDPDIGMRCGITGSDIDRLTFCSCRLSDCPLVEIKVPHGRLIDADVLCEAVAKFDWGQDTYPDEHAIDIICDAPTVLEAGK